MHLFGKSKELEVRKCSHWQLQVRPENRGGEHAFIVELGELGGAVINKESIGEKEKFEVQ